VDGLLYVSGVGWGLLLWSLHRIVIVVVLSVRLVGCVVVVVVFVGVVLLLVLLLWALGLWLVSSRRLSWLLVLWECVRSLLCGLVVLGLEVGVCVYWVGGVVSCGHVLVLVGLLWV
jgi:hypothetical protein